MAVELRRVAFFFGFGGRGPRGLTVDVTSSRTGKPHASDARRSAAANSSGDDSAVTPPSAARTTFARDGARDVSREATRAG